MLPKITLKEMRESGSTRLIIYCGHSVTIDAAGAMRFVAGALSLLQPRCSP